jgi:hypothetical protein
MKKILTCLILACTLSAPVMAQRTPSAGSASAGLPDIVVDGFKEFMSGGYTAATNAWARDSSLLLDSQALQSLNNYFNQVSSNAGTFVGADIVRVVKLSANTESVFAVAKFQRQVVFMSFTCYRTSDKWLITWIDANKDPSLILPTNIMSGQ